MNPDYPASFTEAHRAGLQALCDLYAAATKGEAGGGATLAKNVMNQTIASITETAGGAANPDELFAAISKGFAKNAAELLERQKTFKQSLEGSPLDRLDYQDRSNRWDDERGDYSRTY